MDEQFSKSIFKKLFKDIQTLLTVGYLFAVAIGMLFNYKKYILFHINIFDYAGLFDFLIAPFGDFNIALFTLGTILLTALIYKLDLFWHKKYPDSYSKFLFKMDLTQWYQRQKYVMGIFVFVLYLFLGADIYAKHFNKSVVTQNPIAITFGDNSKSEGILIGKTTDYIFLLQDQEIKAIPMTALIKEIKIK
ncbi:hypothetical protein [Myroides odoratus]|uniref:hypothetical protein n=1 Tax=Myroides odoratus TaxID=256 RepID=UPI0039AF62E4